MSLCNISKALIVFRDNKRSYVAVWKGYKVLDHFKFTWKKFFALIIDETIIQIGNHHFCLWYFIELIHHSVFGIYISKDRTMDVFENLSDRLFKNMETILCTQTMVHAALLHNSFTR